ncbi:ParB family chromosome partitioning protein [Plasticicumulans lactativorans]|uniref:Probable chromosome-partitioning protein ParB n=1 Tax=Plasticicumulans lactativorans TaxID=1133106 RepID=A0A4R2L2B3_9GAMM|nr:ParB/RepB/Spo0J family partition protein [Plasticicumulans lactativorans]TCO81214.1 ParB family chromosome partitioning protein [Plasticicumulans lactativorans]
MAIRKGGLGRGLDALLGSSSASAVVPATGDGVLKQLPVELIERGRYQPRVDMRAETLQELADSIRAQGVVQPVVVRGLPGGRYELIAGERRWRAAQLAGLAEVPALVRDVPDQAVVAIALIENIQREALNPLEEAAALQRLIEEFDLTHQGAAEAIGRSRTAVTNLLRLLDLSAEVQKLVQERKLEMGHARALLPLPAALQLEAARQVCLRGLSVRETEVLARRLAQGGAAPVAPKSLPDPDINRLQDDLAQRLGARVQVQHGAGGRGRLVIHYNDLDELDGILKHLH